MLYYNSQYVNDPLDAIREKPLLDKQLFFPTRMIGVLALFQLMLVVSGCTQGEDSVNESGIEYSTIDWVELIPEDELEALRNQPDFLDLIEDGSAEDQISSQMQSELDQEPQTAYEKALVSANVVATFDNQNIRIPGFIVPLEFTEDFVVTEFFLVPYFGACLHSPPPPPNQIVFVKHEQGIQLDTLEQPYWISGLLTTVGELNDTAHAAYSMTAKNIALYEPSYEE